MILDLFQKKNAKCKRCKDEHFSHSQLNLSFVFFLDLYAVNVKSNISKVSLILR